MNEPSDSVEKIEEGPNDKEQQLKEEEQENELVTNFRAIFESFSNMLRFNLYNSLCTNDLFPAELKPKYIDAIGRTFQTARSAMDKYHKETNFEDKIKVKHDYENVFGQEDKGEKAWQIYLDTGVSIDSLVFADKKHNYENLKSQAKDTDEIIAQLEQELENVYTDVIQRVDRVHSKISSL